MFLDIIHHPVFIWKKRLVYTNNIKCNITRAVFLDKDRTMDNVQKHNICNAQYTIHTIQFS
jgi:hypothetical protein